MAEPETTRFQHALHDLMRSFDELQADVVARHLGPEAEDDDDIEITAEQDEAIDNELALRVRQAMSAMLESERFETGEVAALVSYLNDALAVIDPDLFEDEEEDEEEPEGGEAKP